LQTDKGTEMKNPTDRHDITVAVRIKADDYALLCNMIGDLGCKRMSDVIRLCLEPAIAILREDAADKAKREAAKAKRQAKKAGTNVTQ
tara:strand:- start:1091 stop:1354 length:264 start_codon:yes stop_codon:yes gene_type:complete